MRLTFALSKSNFWTKSASAFLGKVVTALSGIALSALATRLLSPSEAGVFFLATSVATFFATASLFGLNQVAIRGIAAAQAETDEELAISVGKSVLGMFLIGASLLSVIYIAGLGNYISLNILNSDQLRLLTTVIALWFFLQATQTMISDIFRGFNRISSATFFGGTLSGAITVAILTIIYITKIEVGLKTIVTSCILAIALSLLVATRSVLSILKGKIFDHSKERIKEMAGISWPIWFGNILIFILTQANIWIVSSTGTTTDLALYGAASRAASLFWFTSAILYSVLPPVIAGLYAKKEKLKLEKVLRKAASINTVVMLPFFIFALFYSETYLRVLFGHYYQDAAEIFIVLSIANLVNLATGIRGYVLLMAGFEKTQLWLSLIGGALSVVLSYLGMKLGGVLYSAVGVTVATICQCLLEMAAVKVKIGIYTHVNIFSKSS